MSKPNVKMAIIILMTIVAIILSLYFYTKEMALVAMPGAESLPVLDLDDDDGKIPNRPTQPDTYAQTDHNHPDTYAQTDHNHPDTYPDAFRDFSHAGHNHPGDMAIWKAQIDAVPAGAYDVRPLDSNGNLSSDVFDNMKESFKESNLMLIGNNSTDIHFLNGGLLMKGFEDHVKKPLRDDVSANAANITDITKDSAGGLLYAAKARITQNETDIENIGDGEVTGYLFDLGERIAAAGISTNAEIAAASRIQTLYDIKEVFKEEGDYYEDQPGTYWDGLASGANTAYNKANSMLYNLGIDVA